VTKTTRAKIKKMIKAKVVPSHIMHKYTIKVAELREIRDEVFRRHGAKEYPIGVSEISEKKRDVVLGNKQEIMENIKKLRAGDKVEIIRRTYNDRSGLGFECYNATVIQLTESMIIVRANGFTECFNMGDIACKEVQISKCGVSDCE